MYKTKMLMPLIIASSISVFANAYSQQIPDIAEVAIINPIHSSDQGLKCHGSTKSMSTCFLHLCPIPGTLPVLINNVSKVTAKNIRATLGTNPKWSDVTVSYSNCNKVLPGETCTVTFTYPIFNINISAETITFQGENTTPAYILMDVNMLGCLPPFTF